jgi:phosphoadenosine phosphosulfate reductase
MILPEELKTLQYQFEIVHPEIVLAWAWEICGNDLAVVTSFQPTGIVTLHMLQNIAPEVDILTVDTDLLFPETYELIEKLTQRFHLNLKILKSPLTVEAQAEQYGAELWKRNPDQCCLMRKKQVIDDGLKNYSGWITGLRRDQSSGRSNVPIIQWDETHLMLKISPFATWTESMMWTYIHAYELPYNTLHDKSYPSIGCYPCTSAVKDGEDARSGRWRNQGKSECGIHGELHKSSPSTLS